MWDNVTPLQLLKTMPKVLEKEHLEKLQNLFVADKYKNQIISGGDDLCGQYAPFCAECDKDSEFPCATAYVNFMKAQGVDIEIASTVEQLEKQEEEPVDEFADNESVAPEEAVSETDETEVKTEEAKREKIKIRIAVARKKNLL